MWEQVPNLRHLAAFLEVALRRNISQASEHIHLSQPAITQAIAKLERDLGVELFERGPSGMEPTEPAKLYAARVKRALAFLQTGARETLRLAAKKRSGGFANFDRLLTVAQLRALAAVSKSGNFSLAAREMRISQPSLHRAARDLERLCGVKLFEKSRKGIELTEPAEALALNARLAFAELRQGSAETGEWSGRDHGYIVIGCLPLARTHVLPAALGALVREKPRVNVRVYSGPYDDLLYQLRHGEIDLLLGALRIPAPIADIVQTAFFSDPLAILARAGHPLAKKTAITPADLKDYGWVLPPEGAPARNYFDKAFGAIRRESTHGITETSSSVMVRGLLLESDRLAVISAHQLRYEVLGGEITVLPIPMPDSERPIGVTVRAGWRPTATQEAFLKHLRAACEAEGF
jgi:LysR family transcriptional regulator, regulator for genes of the gallate degradation pathway